jgi:hypothetical protein
MIKYRAYIIGNLSAKTQEQIQANINLADECAKEVFNKGYAIIVPHKIMGDWYGTVDEEMAMDSCLSLLETCHIAVICNPAFTESEGSMKEVDFARENGIPIYADVSIVPPAYEFIPDTTTVAIQIHLARRRVGVKTYGQPLRPNNGRNSLKDVVEEDFDKQLYEINYMLEHCPEAVAELLSDS